MTTDGAAVLDPRATEQSPEPSQQQVARPALVVRPDLRVAVSLQASWYDRFLLERFARWVEERQGTAYYVLDEAALRHALQRGVTVAQVISFLRRATAGRVPARVQRTLQSWAEAHPSSP
ncbi:MAG: hypothetical protein FJ026_10020 [Chloroflexi bacterium]|nr:hypothetical protein [Chloroflexota bacterium]